MFNPHLIIIYRREKRRQGGVNATSKHVPTYRYEIQAVTRFNLITVVKGC